VGRADERALFRSALAADTAPFSVLYVHGPGGIGKSSLLQRFADDARQAGREVVRVDGRMVGPSPDAFEAAARGAAGTSG
jgi:ABC-type transport system involved in cytochrome c biogenesis ATPase subunit